MAVEKQNKKECDRLPVLTERANERDEKNLFPSSPSQLCVVLYAAAHTHKKYIQKKYLRPKRKKERKKMRSENNKNCCCVIKKSCG